MIDWKRKLSSRKFWMAVVGFVTGLLVFCGMSEGEAAQIGGIIMSGASVISYIIAEGMVDASNGDYIFLDGEEDSDDGD